MKEYTINLRNDGSAVIAKDYWYRGNDFKRMTENPYLFEVGMKVVDPWGNIVTISQVNKRPSIDNKAPQWTLNVEENGNTYVYYEIAGIFIKELSKEELNLLLYSSEKQLYEPYDNSWCVNLKTGRDAFLTKAYSDPEEEDAIFTIVSQPYETSVSYGTSVHHKCEFVNVKSSKTGNIYRTLFNERCLIK